MTETFDTFFRRATGYKPYGYQRELATVEPRPSILEVPTGAGKTDAVLADWLFRRRVTGKGPRRLAYALPMRALVEQTVCVAREMRERLGLTDDELGVHILMGGEDPVPWREAPERDQILIGTVDMLLSRALNRGYAEGRFVWPIAFGLLNNDTRWVFDEIQLMGPARSTSAQLDALRSLLGTALPCETLWLSATVDREALVTIDRPAPGGVLGLPKADRKGPLSKRLNARKTLVRTDVAGKKGSADPQAVAKAVVSRHKPGTRTIVVLNTVTRAQDVRQAVVGLLDEESRVPEVILLHSRFRPRDRAALMDRVSADPAAPGTIVVATQVIEAGIDISSKLLATETAPFSSIVQRVGRCNRAGEFKTAEVLWLDAGETAGDKSKAAPYEPEDLDTAREALLRLEGKSLSPSLLEREDVAEKREIYEILRRKDLFDLFDTSPDLSGLDVDIARLIRDADDRSVSVFFRALASDAADEPAAARQERAPHRDELVGVPIPALKGRECHVFDHVDGVWRRAGRDELRPGVVVKLDAADGGYNDEIGWSTALKDPVAVVEVDWGELRDGGSGTADAFGSDPGSEASEWVTLEQHLRDVHSEAEDLAVLIRGADLPAGAADAFVAAAALHDVGKAHTVFQDRLRHPKGSTGDPPPDGLLAKSPRASGGRYRRPHFRHELASALAVRTGDWGFDVERELTVYLVAAHHGRVRLSIRPAPAEEAPVENGQSAARFALGIVDGDTLPPVKTPVGQVPASTLDLACMELGSEQSWAASAASLCDDPSLGPFRLGFLEGILRMADWRGSA